MLNQNATVVMFTCDLYAGSPPPHDLERLRTTMQRRVVDFVRVGYCIPINGPLNGHPPSMILKLYMWRKYEHEFPMTLSRVYAGVKKVALQVTRKCHNNIC